MRRSDYQSFYPGKTSNEESATVDVIHPCDQLTLVMEFPRKYSVVPQPRATDQNGAEVALKGASISFQADRLANRFTLVVRKPVLQYKYTLFWQVPD